MSVSQRGFPVPHLYLHKVTVWQSQRRFSEAAAEERKYPRKRVNLNAYLIISMVRRQNNSRSTVCPRCSLRRSSSKISPIIRSMKLNEGTPRVLEGYYLQLLKTPAVHKVTQRKGSTEKVFVAPPTVRKVHNLLRSCFHQAVKWELMEKTAANIQILISSWQMTQECRRSSQGLLLSSRI